MLIGPTCIFMLIHNNATAVLYTDIYNNCFPYKKIKRSDRRLNKHWISSGLLKSIKKKNMEIKLFLLTTGLFPFFLAFQNSGKKGLFTVKFFCA